MGGDLGFESDDNEVLLALSTGENIALRPAQAASVKSPTAFSMKFFSSCGWPCMHRPMNPDLLRQYLEFYQDLGVKNLYRRPAAPPATTEAVPIPAETAEEQRVALPAGSAVSLPEPWPASGGTLLQILEDIGDCRRCRLHEGRTKLVFGVGNEKSGLVFVGEGPGADEDAQGIPPFIDRAEQLLTQMIENTARGRRGHEPDPRGMSTSATWSNAVRQGTARPNPMRWRSAASFYIASSPLSSPRRSAL